MFPDMRQRLDSVLVDRGLVQSRSRARDLIQRGAVRISGEVAQKAGQLVGTDAELSVDGDANAYVARSGVKLAAGLSAFGFSPEGCIGLDIGASTGGFTQVLLEGGARKVYAVDVGHDQLAAALLTDRRVVSLEGRDVRGLSQVDIGEGVNAIVVDVSFISILQVLEAAMSFALDDCWLVGLVKPQFEVGKEAIGKGGIVKDETAVSRAVVGAQTFIESRGWTVRGTLLSPLPGKKGNEEYLIGAIRNG